MKPFPRTRAQAFEASEDVGRNPSDNPTIGDIIAARYNRRDLLKGALGVTAIAATVSPLAIAAAVRAQAQDATRFRFQEVPAGVDEKHHVADGYDVDVVIRWGDPVLPGAPAFDPTKQTAAGQKLQFGYNNDYLGYLPMPGAANPSRHGLLVVNLEYTNEELMFPGIGADQMTKEQNFAKITKELVDIEMAAHGGAVIEIRRDNGKWQVVAGSKYARRIDSDTVMDVTGPAAGHDRLKTKADPSGRRVLGMINNCAGGLTPWGTWLSCEENFHGYFWGKLAEDHPEARNFKRYGAPGNWQAWGKWHDRFDVTKEPNEANRFGWIVEIDPFDPTSTPKKRTALGRMKHEGAAGIINRDGRYVVYTGDDERFDYVYKFVTRGTVDRNNPAANRDLLDQGTLYVARYNADGSGEWLPLVHGQGPLTAAHGFNSQADVLIETRRAGDLLGATKMDRPEDVEASPKTNKVYVILTFNERRTAAQVDAANPRAKSRFGHIIEMSRRTATTRPPGSPGKSWSNAAIRRWRRSAPPSRPPPLGTAGSACPTTAPSTATAACGSRPTAIPTATPAVPTGCGGSKPTARPAPPRSCSSAVRPAPSCAVRSSRPMTRRCSSPSSIPATMVRSGRRSGGPRISRTPRRAGQTSSPTCRRGLRCSPSPSAAAARSAAEDR
jgi:secreted PhoX family phosphatase